MKILVAVSLACLVFAGCAKKSQDIAPTYTSSQSYKGMTCADLDRDLATLATRVQTLSGDQDERATRDAVTTGVGAVIFLPALLLLMQGDDAEELGRLKGEYEAILRAQEANDCAV